MHTSIPIHLQPGNRHPKSLPLSVCIDIETKSSLGKTPLMLASSTSSDTVEYLIKQGASVNAVNENGDTALHFACRDSIDESPALLVDHEAGINTQNNDGQTPLHVCMYNEHADHCAVLLLHGASVDIQDQEGRSPLFLARFDSCHILIEHGASVNMMTNTGLTPIKRASYQGHEDCCKLLIEKGALVNQPSANGRTPLMAASEHGHVCVCRVLVKSDAAVNIQDEAGRAALHYAADYGRDDCCRLLLENGANVDISCKIGETPLHRACYGGHLDCCKCLLEFGANLKAINVSCRTAIYAACMKGHKKCCQFLLEGGAAANTPTVHGETAIAVSSHYGYLECIRLLIEHGAFVNCRGHKIDTPLFIACQEGHTQSVELLLENGADTSLSGSGQQRPIDIAKSKGHGDIVKIMNSSESRARTSKPTFGALTKFFRRKSHSECLNTLVCRSFKDMLKLEDGYFNPKFDVCFCETCLTKRGDNMYYTRGEPPKSYGLPIGWYKFGLVAPAKAVCVDAFGRWHVAFHGTQVDKVQQILETGDLLMPGDLTPDGARLRPPINHFNDENPAMAPPAGHDVSRIYLSPSIRYAGLEVYAPKLTYIDPTTEIIHQARVAFQVRIKPETYDVGDQTVGVERQIDPKFPNSELEWSTERRGVIVLVGLLVKVEGLTGATALDMGSLCPAVPQTM